MAPHKVNVNVKTSIDLFLDNPDTVTAILNEYRGVLRTCAQRRNLRARIRQRLQRLQNHFTTQPDDATMSSSSSAERLKRILANPDTASQILHSATVDLPLNMRSDLADKISNRLQTLKHALNKRMKKDSEKPDDGQPPVDCKPNIFKKPSSSSPPTKNMHNGEWYLNIYHPSNGHINANQMAQIRLQMMMECVSDELGQFCPRFGRSRPLKGKFHVVCLDRPSREWLTQHVERMGFAWDNDAPEPAAGKNKLKTKKLIRMYQWSAFFYVDQPVSKDFVLELLQRQNSRLDLSRWEIDRFDTVLRDGWTGMGDDGNGSYSGHYIVFAMPYACQRQLLMQNCGVHFGLNVVRLDRCV